MYLACVLQDACTNWQFDIFAFAEECKGKSLSVLGFHLYKQGGLIKEFKLDDAKFINFLQKVESGYNAVNPYHNRWVSNMICSAALWNAALLAAPTITGGSPDGMVCMLHPITQRLYAWSAGLPNLKLCDLATVPSIPGNTRNNCPSCE